jgi:hypothetical protein
VSHEFKPSHLPPCPPTSTLTLTSQPVASTCNPILPSNFKDSTTHFHQCFSHHPLQEQISLSQTKFLPCWPRPSNKPYLRPIQVLLPLSDSTIKILCLQAKLTELNNHHCHQLPTNFVPLIEHLSDPIKFFEPAAALLSLTFHCKSGN